MNHIPSSTARSTNFSDSHCEDSPKFFAPIMNFPVPKPLNTGNIRDISTDFPPMTDLLSTSRLNDSTEPDDVPRFFPPIFDLPSNLSNTSLPVDNINDTSLPKFLIPHCDHLPSKSNKSEKSDSLSLPLYVSPILEHVSTSKKPVVPLNPLNS